MSIFFTPVVSGAGHADDGEAMLHAIQMGAYPGSLPVDFRQSIDELKTG